MATKNKRTGLAGFFAPGAGRVKEFSVQLHMESNSDSFKVDWKSFKQSTQVKEQMRAARSSKMLKHG